MSYISAFKKIRATAILVMAAASPLGTLSFANAASQPAPKASNREERSKSSDETEHQNKERRNRRDEQKEAKDENQHEQEETTARDQRDSDRKERLEQIQKLYEQQKKRREKFINRVKEQGETKQEDPEEKPKEDNDQKGNRRDHQRGDRQDRNDDKKDDDRQGNRGRNDRNHDRSEDQEGNRRDHQRGDRQDRNDDKKDDDRQGNRGRNDRSHDRSDDRDGNRRDHQRGDRQDRQDRQHDRWQRDNWSWNQSWWGNQSDNPRNRSYVGKVTEVLSYLGRLRKFDILVDGKRYTVRPRDGSNRELHVNDWVRVIGERQDGNDLNDAWFTVLSRGDDYYEDQHDERLFVGKVTKITSREAFDVRIDGETYDVFPMLYIPTELRVGDIVRIRGRLYTGNNIINAETSILSQGNDDDCSSTQVVIGEVTEITPYGDRPQFNIRTGSQAYQIFPIGGIQRAMRLSDQVLVIGQRSGDNEIRDAQAIVLRSQNSRPIEVFTGEIKTIKSDQGYLKQFDIRVGNQTYQIFPDEGVQRKLYLFDKVLVTGWRDGGNILRDAHVIILDREERNGRLPAPMCTQLIVGEVSSLDNEQRFEIRVGDSTYTVFPMGGVPREMQLHDKVLVEGWPEKDNHINDARVTFLGNS